jgi:hypothetical protein
MKYSRFEELPVWKDAIELAVRVFALTALPAFRRYKSVRDQIERSSMSVSNNVAEGLKGEPLRKRLLSFISRAGHRAKPGPSFVSVSVSMVLPISNLRSQISKRWPRKSRVNCGPGVNRCKTLTSEDNGI